MLFIFYKKGAYNHIILGCNTETDYLNFNDHP